MCAHACQHVCTCTYASISTFMFTSLSTSICVKSWLHTDTASSTPASQVHDFLLPFCICKSLLQWWETWLSFSIVYLLIYSITEYTKCFRNANLNPWGKTPYYLEFTICLYLKESLSRDCNSNIVFKSYFGSCFTPSPRSHPSVIMLYIWKIVLLIYHFRVFPPPCLILFLHLCFKN